MRLKYFRKDYHDCKAQELAVALSRVRLFPVPNDFAFEGGFNPHYLQKTQSYEPLLKSNEIEWKLEIELFGKRDLPDVSLYDEGGERETPLDLIIDGWAIDTRDIALESVVMPILEELSYQASVMAFAVLGSIHHSSVPLAMGNAELPDDMLEHTLPHLYDTMSRRSPNMQRCEEELSQALQVLSVSSRACLKGKYQSETTEGKPPCTIFEERRFVDRSQLVPTDSYKEICNVSKHSYPLSLLSDECEVPTKLHLFQQSYGQLYEVPLYSISPSLSGQFEVYENISSELSRQPGTKYPLHFAINDRNDTFNHIILIVNLCISAFEVPVLPTSGLPCTHSRTSIILEKHLASQPPVRIQPNRQSIIDLAPPESFKEEAATFINRLWDEQIHFSDDTIATFPVPTIQCKDGISPSSFWPKYFLCALTSVTCSKPLRSLEIRLPPAHAVGWATSLENTIMPSPNGQEIKLEKANGPAESYGTEELSSPGHSFADRIHEPEYLECGLNGVPIGFALRCQELEEDIAFLSQVMADCTILRDEDGIGAACKFHSMLDSLPSIEQFEKLLDIAPPQHQVMFLEAKIYLEAYVENRQKENSQYHPEVQPINVPEIYKDIPDEGERVVVDSRTYISPSKRQKLELKQVVPKLSASLDDFMKTRGVESVEKVVSDLWEKQFTLAYPSGSKLYDFQLNIVEEVRRMNSLLVLPPALCPYPITSLLIYNYLSFAKVLVLWTSADRRSLEHAYHYHKLYCAKAETNKMVVLRTAKELESLSNSSKDKSALLFLEPDILEETVRAHRELFQKLSFAIFDSVGMEAGACSSLIRHLAKSTLAPFNKKRILALSRYPARTNEEMFGLVSAYSLEQIILRTVDDADVRPYLTTCTTVELEVTEPISTIYSSLNEIRDSLLLLVRGNSLLGWPPLYHVPSAAEVQQKIEETDQQLNNRLKSQTFTDVAKLEASLQLLSQLYVITHTRERLLKFGLIEAASFFIDSTSAACLDEALAHMFRSVCSMMQDTSKQVEAGVVPNPSCSSLLIQRLLKKTADLSFTRALIVAEHTNDLEHLSEYLSRIPSLHLSFEPPNSMNVTHYNCFLATSAALVQCDDDQFLWQWFDLVIEFGDGVLRLTPAFLEDVFSGTHLHFVRMKVSLMSESDPSVEMSKAWVNILRSHYGIRKEDGSDSLQPLTVYQLFHHQFPETLLKGLSLYARQAPVQPAADANTAPTPTTIIVGERVLQDQELLILLQRDHHIHIVERTLSSSVTDILLNEKMAMILVSTAELADSFDAIADYLSIECSQKCFERCWLVVTNYIDTTTSLFIINSSVENLMQAQELTTGLATFCIGLKCTVMIRYSFDRDETASFIRMACDTTANSCSSMVPSQESFLNPYFTTQLYVNIRMQRYPSIASELLERFHRIVNALEDDHETLRKDTTLQSIVPPATPFIVANTTTNIPAITTMTTVPTPQQTVQPSPYSSWPKQTNFKRKLTPVSSTASAATTAPVLHSDTNRKRGRGGTTRASRARGGGRKRKYPSGRGRGGSGGRTGAATAVLDKLESQSSRGRVRATCETAINASQQPLPARKMVFLSANGPTSDGGQTKIGWLG
ncbi:hypothetical protein QOT17_002485 [Balamuthia mandrillaris]